MRRGCVLVIDDVPANLLAFEAILQSDHDVICAESGPRAVVLLELRQDVDVVLLDVRMPSMDGYEAAERIRKIDGYHDVPIVFITADDDRTRHAQAGYEDDDCFIKPVDPDALRQKIQSCLLSQR
jgi:CheY-like chemotaxis protein